MINAEKMSHVLAAYRQAFHTPDPDNYNLTGWQKEQYKWIAVKHFQEHWDIDAPDFVAMFKKATAKTGNLLSSMNYFPRNMIVDLANADEEAVRAMFKSLSDENTSVVDRVNHFIKSAEKLRAKYGDKIWKSHYQNVNSVSTYLWLMYPDKYYIYKYSECKQAAAVLESDFKVKKGAKTDVLLDFSHFYDEIAEYIASDTQTTEMLKAALTSECYEDPQYRTLAMDVGFYISRYYSKNGKVSAKNTETINKAWFVGASGRGSTDYTDLFISENRWENMWDNGYFYSDVNSVAVGDHIVIKATYTKKNVPFEASGKSVSVLGIKAIGTVTGNSSDGKNLSVDWVKVDPKKEWFDSCSYRDTIHLVKATDGPNQKALLDFVFNNIEQDYSSIEAKYTVDLYWPSVQEYQINITKDEWKKYIEEVELPSHKGCMGMLKALMELGGEASCKKLSNIYGGNPARYIGSAVNIGKRAKKYFDLPPCMDGEAERYFAIPFLGKNVTEVGAEYYSYKIRDELFAALKEIDLSSIDPYVQDNEEGCGYWWLNANPKIWSFADIAVNAEQSYTLYNDNGNKRRVFQNFLDTKVGDKVIGYESTPVKQIVAIAEISKEHDDKELFFKKIEGLSIPVDYQTLRECPELENMEYFAQPQGSLFRLTEEEFECIMDLIRENNPAPVQAEECEKYEKDDFLKEVFMSEDNYDSLVALLKNKKNVILQGAPGVGKTFAAKRIAYSIMGEKDESRIEFVQFHQNYSYEDFMMGYKPTDNGFELKYGIFYRFCQIAANHPDKEYFFIIDEINRGNMSKIFGELLMLIEKDYRGKKATLAYNGMSFSVPENLYIIGMMNTADRSLAMIDYALRRRFSFYSMEPGFATDGFKAYQSSVNNAHFDKLVAEVENLNKAITNDKSLGSGFCIGHSYFLSKPEDDIDDWVKGVARFDIVPMLQEYWFDDTDSVKKWADLLSGAVNG